MKANGKENSILSFEICFNIYLKSLLKSSYIIRNVYIYISISTGKTTWWSRRCLSIVTENFEFMESKFVFEWTVADLALKIVSLYQGDCIACPIPVMSAVALVNIWRRIYCRVIKTFHTICLNIRHLCSYISIESPILLLIHPPLGQELVCILL